MSNGSRVLLCLIVAFLTYRITAAFIDSAIVIVLGGLAGVATLILTEPRQRDRDETPAGRPTDD